MRLFAGLRERAGRETLELELPDGALVADALELVSELCGEPSCVMAVNREYAGADTPLHAEDELALIPPVSGGADTAALHARIRSEPLSLDALLARVRDPRAGAIVTFHGVTRDVEALEYEAYTEMAESRLRAIVEAAALRYELCAAAAEHRVGTVPLSEPSVLVAVSAPHRAAAFAAGREIIDRIKTEAPIWKREEGAWADGSVPPLGP